MNALLKTRPVTTALCELVAPAADSWMAFSERHEKRLNALIVNTFVLDHCLETIGGDVSPYTSAAATRNVPEAIGSSAAGELGASQNDDRHERRKKSKRSGK